MMEHLTKGGESKLVERLHLPGHRLGCVDRIYTDLAVIDVTPEGLSVREIVEGLGIDELVRMSGVAMHEAERPAEAGPTSTPGARMPEAFICDAVRTPIGRYGGALAGVRTDDLGAMPIKALVERNPCVDPRRDRGRRLRLREPGGRGQSQRRAHGAAACRAPAACRARPSTGCAARGWMPSRIAARAIQRRRDVDRDRRGRRDHVARAVRPGQAAERLRARPALYDTTLGWRFVNPGLKAQYGIDSMAETAENVAAEFGIPRRPGRVRAAQRRNARRRR